MTDKQIALDTINRLPENTSWEEIQERLYFIAGLKRALKELDQGQGISQQEVEAEVATWLRK